MKAARSRGMLLGGALLLASCATSSRGTGGTGLAGTTRAHSATLAPSLGEPGGELSAVAGVCPSQTMSCFPGCATLDGTLLCGQTLLVAAGGLGAALIYLAVEEGTTTDELCTRYNTLCASKAKPKAKDKVEDASTEVGKRPCLYVATKGEGAPGGPRRMVTCIFKCGDSDKYVYRTIPGTSADCLNLTPPTY